MSDRDPRYFDDIEIDLSDADRPRQRPRRRARMGQVVKGLGRKAAAKPRVGDVTRTVEQRQRAEKAKMLTEGGKNKGEEKGYGVTSGPVAPPEKEIG